MPNNKPKTEQVMKIDLDAMHLTVIRCNFDTMNPYHIYTRYWESGWHRIELAKYADLNSVVCFLHDNLVNIHKYTASGVQGWIRAIKQYGRC